MVLSANSRSARHLSRILGALALSTLFACSAAGDGDRMKPAPTEQESVGDDGSEGAENGGKVDEEDPIDLNTGNVDEGDPEACVATSATADEVALDLIILLDRSGSMYGQNWSGSTTALKQFIKDKDSDGINVGILYFPVDSPPDGLVCNHYHYDDLVVPLGTLPENSSKLTGSIDAQSPNGGSTPMFGALEGALFAATARKDANPKHKVVLVFASDGDPNSCTGNENDINTIAGLAGSALNYNGVETYVIAIAGASVANLNKIAKAGGTGEAFDVTGDVSLFADKMSQIREKALACEYAVPEPPGNMPLELDKVAVKLAAGDGTTKEFPRADDASNCGEGAGWYYDDPETPTKIKLCPASCSEVQADAAGEVKMFFGCKPEIK
jgi:hypothetical protein